MLHWCREAVMFMLGYIKGSRPYEFSCDSFLSPFSDLLKSRSNLNISFVTLEANGALHLSE